MAAGGSVPISLTVDHGTEFTSKALEKWAWQRGIKLDFTRPGKPTDNGHIEPLNGRRTPSEFIQIRQGNGTREAATV